MTQMNPPAGHPDGEPDGEDLPDTPVSIAAILRWSHEAAWTVPCVINSQAQDDEPGAVRMVAAEVTDVGLVVTLENDQVFVMTAREITRPSGQTGHPFTLNPAGQRVTHASQAGTVLCPLAAPDAPATADWAGVTCLDCQTAAPSRDLASIDDLGRRHAERQVRGILIATSPYGLTLFEVMRRTGRDYRAAAGTALDALTGQGQAATAGDPAGPQPAWRSTEGY